MLSVGLGCDVSRRVSMSVFEELTDAGRKVEQVTHKSNSKGREAITPRPHSHDRQLDPIETQLISVPRSPGPNRVSSGATALGCRRSGDLLLLHLSAKNNFKQRRGLSRSRRRPPTPHCGVDRCGKAPPLPPAHPGRYRQVCKRGGGIPLKREWRGARVLYFKSAPKILYWLGAPELLRMAPMASTGGRRMRRKPVSPGDLI